MIRIWASVLLAAVLVPPRSYAAPCAHTDPINYFTFGTPSPADSSVGVARDTILILRGQGYGIGGSPILPSWFEVATVKMTDQAGNDVPGGFGSRDFSKTLPVVSWRPRALLAENTTYQVVATLAEQRQTRPAEVVGSERLDFSFSTGTGLTPPLELQGALSATLSESTVPIMTCDPDPGCGACNQTGQRSALMAQVTLPAVHGGMDEEGYEGVLFLTDTKGVTFKGPGGTTDVANLVTESQSFHTQPGQSQTISIEIPRKKVAYVPCFSMNVWDPSSQNVTADVLCLEPVAAQAAGSGCMVAGDLRPGSAMWALLILVGGTALVRKRRRR